MRIILLGPTASGKTNLSLQVAEELGIPIISVDSRQCYKHLDIGTAKPSQEELERAKHYNISNLDLDEPDSVQAFSERAEVWEKEILKSSDHSFFVGGSTLHLQSLIRPIDETPSANKTNIAEIESQIDKEGIEPVYNKLNSVDPEYVKTMDGMNRQRIIRALDVWMQTGKPFSSFHSNEEFELPDDTLVFGLQRDRQNLYDRINRRVDQMIEDGLIAETQKVLEMGYSKDLQPLNAVGYREIISVLNNEMDLETAIRKIKTQSRRYAKRQLTWFRRWDFIEWLPADEKKPEELKEIILSGLAAKQ
ncbi:MAG: tRNA (adenosine(37)-N6)-dimethylallyltransferase MiaA [Balneola sp.]